MNEGADTGDVIDQKMVEISVDDDAHSLYLKLASLASEQLKEFVPLIKRGKLVLTEQDPEEGK